MFGCRQDAQGKGQVVGGAFLTQAGRREVDRNAFARPAEPQVLDGALDALLALTNGTVGQPHHQEVYAPIDPDFDGHR